MGISALAAFIFICLLYAARTSYLRVEQIEISGTRLFPAAEIEQAVRDDLSGVSWLIIPRNNFFFISGRRISGDILQKFPQLSGIKVNKKFPRKIIIAVEERRLWGVYCLRAESALSPRQCFYLDTRATAYEDMTNFEGWLLPIIYGIEAPKLGGPAVPESMLKFFEDARSALEAIDGNLVWLGVSTTTPEDIRLGLGEGWEAIVTLSRPTSEWMSVLKTVLEHDVGDKQSLLEYIDLRFGNRVFYKYR